MSGRAFGVILEDLDAKMDRVVEGHAALGKGLDDFRREMRIEVGELKFGQNVLRKEVGNLNNKSGELRAFAEREFKVIREYLSRIDDEIQDLKKRLVNKADPAVLFLLCNGSPKLSSR